MLTELAIKNLKPKGKVYRVADSHGLCLEVSPAGGKLWRYRYTFNGKGQMLALGKYPAVSLAEARRRRDEAKAQAEAGQHPTRLRKAQKLRRMEEGENTFERLARRWHDVRESKLNSKYHTQILTRMEQHVFPIIGDLPIKEITIPDVVKVIEKIGGRGTVVTAKRMKQCISQVFRYAAQRGLCDHNPAGDIRDILPSAQKRHHSCVQISELPTLLQKIEAKENDMGKMATRDPNASFLRISYILSTGRKIDYKIPLSHTAPFFGGKRFWLICPITSRRVSKLYFFGEAFISRHACNLNYASQSETCLGRADRKAEKLKRRISTSDDFYYRPKGMHQKTFDRITDKIDAAEERANYYYFSKLQHLIPEFNALY
jgi:hypothetical protein